MKPFLFANLWLLLLAMPAQAQNSIDSTNNFVFRMARKEGSNSSCVMVQANGAFHLERARAKAVLVFEGVLPSDRMAGLNTLLNDDRFRQLLPEAVSSSLLPTGLDEFVLSVPRQGQWLSLRFIAGISSDRDWSLLERFLKWQNSVLKSAHRKLREESGRNNCLPAGELGLKTRAD